MTDRHSGYVITLDRDTGGDDAVRIINAIRMIKGVLSVEPVIASGISMHIAGERHDQQWRGALLRLLKERAER